MGDKPIVALRTLKDSSMRVSDNLVKAGEAMWCQCRQYRRADGDGPVRVESLPGVDNTCLIKALPTLSGRVPLYAGSRQCQLRCGIPCCSLP
ncbi:hypothetical protein ACLK12_05860 [Escherichia coli]